MQQNSLFWCRIEESLSFENVTVVKGDTAMLVCTVTNVGDKSVCVQDIE
jgi:hypothetical protein